MTEKICGTCAAFHPTPQTKGGGQCRARPPHSSLVGMQPTPLGQQPVFTASFPAVSEKDWCRIWESEEG
jgi:hypothetical protein